MVGLGKFLQAQIKTKCKINGDCVFWADTELPVHVIGDQKKVVFPDHKFMISLEELIQYGARVVKRPRALTKEEIKHARNSTAGGLARWNRTTLPPNVYVANKQTIQRALEMERPEIPAEKYIGRISKYRTAVYPTVEEVLEALRLKKFIN